MSTRYRVILISGIITLLATVIISCLCIADWNGVTPWAFTAILWAEIVFFGGLLFVEWESKKTDQIITRSLLYTIIAAYTIINFLVSILYIVLFKESHTSFAIIQIALFSISAISIAISMAASKAVRQSNDQTMKAVDNAEAMIERLNKLLVRPECEPYTSMLKSLSEDLRFTDISKTVPEDADIAMNISEIELTLCNLDDAADEKIKSALVRLKTLIEQRKLSVSSINKGKI